MLNLTPFLLFEGKCEEAMTFYKECLGGELQLTKVGDTPMSASMPPESQNKVVYAHLRCDKIEFSATDWLRPNRTPKQGNTAGMYINGGTFDELKQIFDKLKVGCVAEDLDELTEMPFGTYGHIADKYGVQWFFQGDPQPKS